MCVCVCSLFEARVIRLEGIELNDFSHVTVDLMYMWCTSMTLATFFPGSPGFSILMVHSKHTIIFSSHLIAKSANCHGASIQ